MSLSHKVDSVVMLDGKRVCRACLRDWPCPWAEDDDNHDDNYVRRP